MKSPTKDRPRQRIGLKSVYTTGEVSQICSVSQQTVIRCFDKGDLKGFRVPGSRFRRIPRDSLLSFMKEHNIPLDHLETGKKMGPRHGRGPIFLLVDGKARTGPLITRYSRTFHAFQLDHSL